MTIDEIYAFVEHTIQECRRHGANDIAQEFTDALHLGSSGLEILGAIKKVFVAQAARLEKIVPGSKVAEVVAIVNKKFGAESS